MTRRFFICRVLAALLAVFSLATTLVAGQGPSAAKTNGTGAKPYTHARTPDGQPDLSGVWVRLPAARQISITDLFAPEEPPMTPWARERYAAAREGLSSPTQQGRDEIDPILYPFCLPVGFPRIYLRPGAMQIAQTRDAVYMFFDNYRVGRQIHTNGRKHPEDPPPSFLGYSIGRWEGDTLVTDTVGFNDLTWLDSMGHPHSTALRVEERIRRLDQNTLEIAFLFDDPKAYTRPWRGKKLFELKPDWELMEYTICEIPSGEDWWKAHGGKREP